MSTTIKQSLTFIIFTVSEKIAALMKFLPHSDSRQVGRPSTDHYINSHFLGVTNVFPNTTSLLKRNRSDEVEKVGGAGWGGWGVVTRRCCNLFVPCVYNIRGYWPPYTTIVEHVKKITKSRRISEKKLSLVKSYNNKVTAFRVAYLQPTGT